MDLGTTVTNAAWQRYLPAQVSSEDALLQAFAAIYDAHGSVVYALASRITRDRGLAEEAVQAAFLQVWTGPAGYHNDRADIGRRLRGLVQQCALEAVRRRDSGPEATAADAEHGCPVRAALERLPWAQRQPLLLAHFFGHTYEEIAALTGIPSAAVKSRTFSAMASLRGCLSAAAPDRAT